MKRGNEEGGKRTPQFVVRDDEEEGEYTKREEKEEKTMGKHVEKECVLRKSGEVKGCGDEERGEKEAGERDSKPKYGKSLSIHSFSFSSLFRGKEEGEKREEEKREGEKREGEKREGVRLVEKGEGMGVEMEVIIQDLSQIVFALLFSSSFHFFI